MSTTTEQFRILIGGELMEEYTQLKHVAIKID